MTPSSSLCEQGLKICAALNMHRWNEAAMILLRETKRLQILGRHLGAGDIVLFGR